MSGHPIDPFFDAWQARRGTLGVAQRESLYRAFQLDGQWDRERLRLTLRAILAIDAESRVIFHPLFEGFFPVRGTALAGAPVSSGEAATVPPSSPVASTGGARPRAFTRGRLRNRIELAVLAVGVLVVLSIGSWMALPRLYRVVSNVWTTGGEQATSSAGTGAGSTSSGAGGATPAPPEHSSFVRKLRVKRPLPEDFAAFAAIAATVALGLVYERRLLRRRTEARRETITTGEVQEHPRTIRGSRRDPDFRSMGRPRPFSEPEIRLHGRRAPEPRRRPGRARRACLRRRDGAARRLVRAGVPRAADAGGFGRRAAAADGAPRRGALA